MFKISCPGHNADVDLDDIKIYPKEWHDMKISELHLMIWKELGASLYYMQYFNPKVDFGSQTERVHNFCFWYAQERKDHYLDTKENRLWCYKFLYRFQDEVENQC